VLKPGGEFVLTSSIKMPLAEDWAVLKLIWALRYCFQVLSGKKTIIATGAKVVSQQPGELFNLYKVRFEIAQHRKRGLASSSTCRQCGYKTTGPVVGTRSNSSKFRTRARKPNGRH